MLFGDMEGKERPIYICQRVKGLKIQWDQQGPEEGPMW